MTRIAFIGLGNMGMPMATHLVKQGHDVRAYDLSASARKTVKSAGVSVSDSVNEVVLDAMIVISMLSSSEQVRALYLGAQSLDNHAHSDNAQDNRVQDNHTIATQSEIQQPGIFSLLPKGALVIDCSTIAVEDAQELARQASQLGIDFVDAPVSGSIAGAKAARLTFIVGGSDECFGKAKPILLSMGNTVFHAGQSGAGQGAKICNNMMLGILMSGSAEVLNLGQKNGVNPAVLTDIMIHSSGRNWALEVYNPYPEVSSGVPANSQYTGGFSSSNMYKDLQLALQVARSSNVNVPMGEQATELYAAHVADYGAMDFSSIMVRYDPTVLSSK